MFFFFHLSHLIKLFLIRLVHYLSFVKSGKRFHFVQNGSCLFYQYFVFSYESFVFIKLILSMEMLYFLIHFVMCLLIFKIFLNTLKFCFCDDIQNTLEGFFIFYLLYRFYTLSTTLKYLFKICQ